MFLVVASLAASGCAPASHSCTAADCVDGIAIILSAASDAGSGQLSAGEYSVVVVVDGLQTTTTCPVGGPERPCTGGDIWYSLADESEVRFFLKTTPKSLSVTVIRDGVELASQNVTPKYHDNTPNGPDCEPTCKQANVTVTL